jgi:hypothetical protein
MTTPPVDDARAGHPTEADGGDPSRPVLERTRALAATGDLEGAIATLRDLVVEFPQFAPLSRELDELRKRAGHDEPPPPPVSLRSANPPGGDNLEPPSSPAPAPLPRVPAPDRSVAHARRPRVARAVTVAAVVFASIAALLLVRRFNPDPGTLPHSSSGIQPTPTAVAPVGTADPASPTAVDNTALDAMPDRPLAEPPPPPRTAPRRLVSDEVDPPPAIMAARRPGESEVSWKLRSRDLQLRYESATAALEEQHYADALIWLSAIIEEDASYRNVPELLEEVFRARRSRAAVANREGLELQRRGRLAEAAAAYDRALAIDPEFPEARERLAAVQASISTRVTDALKRAAVVEAFGLTGDAAVAYQEVLTLLPQASSDRRLAEERLRALGPVGEPLLQGAAPSSMRLDPIESTEALEFVDDPGGRFIARLPTRRWQLTAGSGSTIGVVTEKDGRGSLIIEAVPLTSHVSLDTSYDLIVNIESRLVTRRDPAASLVINRTLEPPVPMVILDYRRPGPGGQIRRVRQFSIVRGVTLFRISAMNALAPFYDVEGVFNDFALSFQPTDRAPFSRP